MAKKSKVIKNLQRIKLVKQYWEKRAQLTAIIKDPSKSFDEKMEAQRRIQLLPRDSSRTRIRNRCEISGRPRGYMRMFKMSRIAFRGFALEGLLPGVKKASW